MTEIALIPAEDEDFIWLLDDSSSSHSPGKLARSSRPIDEPRMLEYFRRLASDQRRAALRGSWLIAADGEAAGICTFTTQLNELGEVEFAMVVAENWRGAGVGKLAAYKLVHTVTAPVKVLVAETLPDNIASQRMLQSAGFIRTGTRHDNDLGEMIVWKCELPTSPR